MAIPFNCVRICFLCVVILFSLGKVFAQEREYPVTRFQPWDEQDQEAQYKPVVFPPGLHIAKEGMVAFQKAYSLEMFKTINLNTPGSVEMDVYNEYVDGKLDTYTHYRWRSGQIENTGDDLDVYIESQNRGFLVIQIPMGLGYTRDGRLKRLANGAFVTVAGHYPLLGERGPIFLPPGVVRISLNGIIFVNEDRIDKLQIAVFADRLPLISLNGSVFFMTGEPKLIQGPEHYRVRQGYLEASNTVKALISDLKIAEKSYSGAAAVAKVIYKTMKSGNSMGMPD